MRIDAYLHDFAPGEAEVVPLKFRATDAVLLRLRPAQRQCDGHDRQHGHDPCRSHECLLPKAVDDTRTRRVAHREVVSAET
jgi:hypothetical protein